MTAVPLKVWNGSEWIFVGVQTGQVFYQNEQPATAATGDLWVDANGESSVVNSDMFLTISAASATYATKVSVEGSLTSPYLLMGA